MKHDRLKNVKKCSLFLALLFCSIQIFAQERTITGTITDETGAPMPGVNISVAGTTVGTISDLDGNYSISVPGSEASLQFSFVGYVTQDIVVGDQTAIDVSMALDAEELEEVVVVGYGTMKKSDISGSIVSLKSEELTVVKAGNVLEAMQGKIPGVDLSRSSGRTGSGIDVEIRGERSLQSSKTSDINKPLIIVDGIPYGSDISISPEDIESVEILKDASSTAIYGSRGANGVILITTKRGNAGKPKVYFNSYYSFSQPYQKVPVFDGPGFIDAKNESYRNAIWMNDNTVLWDTIPTPVESVWLTPLQREYVPYRYNTDFQELLQKTGHQQEYNVGFMGGNEAVTYNTSVTYFNEDGVILNDEFKRYNVRANIDANPYKFLSIGTSNNITYGVRSGAAPSFTAAVACFPIYPPKDSLGNWLHTIDPGIARKSPMYQAYHDLEEDRNLRIFSSAYAQINFTPDLTLRSTMGVDLRNRLNAQTIYEKDSDAGAPYNRALVNQQYDAGYTWNNILTYKKQFGDHSLAFMVGNEMALSRWEQAYIQADDIPYARQQWYDVGPAESRTIASNYTKKTMSSFFFRTGYTLKDKYILNVTGRRDGASQLAIDHKWSNFWSYGGAWRISEENFMQPVTFISDLKLRLSYGESGNSNIEAYETSASLDDYTQYEFGEPGSEAVALAYRSTGTVPDITMTWERTGQTNLGLDFGLFKNRIFGNIDVYTSYTTNMLLLDQLPFTTGHTGVLTNAGKTKTQGLEVYLSSINVNTSDFRWKTTFTFGTTFNKIVKLQSGITDDPGNAWFVGQPISVYYDYYMDGIVQLSDTNYIDQYESNFGSIKIADMNRDGVIGEEDRVVYYRDPVWNGNFESVVTFKGFEFAFAVYGRFGNTINAGAYGFDPRLYDTNIMDNDYWTPVNPSNEYPMLLWGAAAQLPYAQVLRYRDGSYAKIKHITLAYTLPNQISSRMALSKLRVYSTLKDPAIIYSKLAKGLDPERGGSTSWPLARLLVFGVNAEF
ncbi:MAG: TonB-dependent receptor [Bacteroidales bacterium]|nr:TonB-dependent receptor [Bacteroidales bacterium]